MMAKPKRSLRSRVLAWLVGSFSLVALMAVAGAVYFNQTLKWAEGEFPKLRERFQEFDRTPSVIVSDDGVVLYKLVPERRLFVAGKEIPTKVLQAIEAAEDKRFMVHEGVDFYALGRILFLAGKEGRASQGGSTLTMQIAKRTTSKGERTLERKIRDAAMAIVVERRMSKEQIIEFYLNESYFGQGAYGIAAAAEVYFNKSLDDLTLGEIATLARCVRSPTRENPVSNPEKARINRDVVLRVMREEGHITEEQYQYAVKEDLVLRTTKVPNLKSKKVQGHFVDFVLGELARELPDINFDSGGYRVETTLDTKLQAEVEGALKSRVRGYRGEGVNIGAFLCMDNEGRIQVMANTGDYEDTQYNVVSQSLLQPGSAFKPFVYSTAFELGVLSPYGQVTNRAYYIREGGRKRAIRSGGPEDEVSVRLALAKSYNRAAMWAEKLAGLENVMATCQTAFGFDHLKPNIETTALGANTVSMTEMAEAYSVFQQKGARVKPYAVKRVIGPDGQVVKSFQPDIQRRVISTDTATGVDGLLRAVVQEGTGAAAGGVANARGKTGTTSDNKDAWFCGYTNRFVGILWLANEHRTKEGKVKRGTMDDVDGKKYAAPSWARLMSLVVDRYGDIPLDPNDPLSHARRIERQPREEEQDSEGVVDPRVFEPIPQADRGGDEPAIPSPAPRDPPASRREPAPRNEDPEEAPGSGKYAYVTVCADTGQVAVSACFNKMRIPFERGTEPRGRCQLHGD